jgi:hypothetical protein
VITEDDVIVRLEEAGATAIFMMGSRWLSCRNPHMEIVRTALESYGWSSTRIRLPAPISEKITRMDEAMSWLSLIPQEKYVLRLASADPPIRCATCSAAVGGARLL